MVKGTQRDFESIPLYSSSSSMHEGDEDGSLCRRLLHGTNPNNDDHHHHHRKQETTTVGRKGMSFHRVSWMAMSLLTFSYVAYRTVVYEKDQRVLVKAPTNYVERKCIEPTYYTLLQEQQEQELARNQEDGSMVNPTSSFSGERTIKELSPKICMVTLTDEKNADAVQRLVRWRNFNSLLNITWSNKQEYCTKHGYYLFDESYRSLDTSRPPSWSKIKAAQRLLTQEECDWVFWLDADTVIMNSTIRIESFLPATNVTTIDFLVAHDKYGTSWNAGSWLIRNTPWSHHFLQTWYDMEEYVMPKGLAVSGDNNALRELLSNRLPPGDYDRHVATPSECQFNSGARFMTPTDYKKYDTPATVTNYEEYGSQVVYHKGDFIGHIMGYNNKIDTAKLLLEDAV